MIGKSSQKKSFSASGGQWKPGGYPFGEWALELLTEVIVGLAGMFHRYLETGYRIRPVPESEAFSLIRWYHGRITFRPSEDEGFLFL